MGIEIDPMTSWPMHELRDGGLTSHAFGAGMRERALRMRINKTDQNNAGAPTRIMRTGRYRSVHIKS
jgi:hypothetical protein